MLPVPAGQWPEPEPTVLELALEAASEYFGFPVKRSFVRRREKSRDVAWVRFWVVAWMRWYSEGRVSYPQIARAVRLGDHTSVMHGEARAFELFPDAEFSPQVGAMDADADMMVLS